MCRKQPGGRISDFRYWFRRFSVSKQLKSEIYLQMNLAENTGEVE